MKYIAAYLLSVIGGNKSPTAADVRKILEAAKANVDDESLEIVIKELHGKSVYDVMDAGVSKLVASSGPRAGGAAPAGGAAASAGGAGVGGNPYGLSPAARHSLPMDPSRKQEEGLQLYPPHMHTHHQLYASSGAVPRSHTTAPSTTQPYGSSFLNRYTVPSHQNSQPYGSSGPGGPLSAPPVYNLPATGPGVPAGGLHLPGSPARPGAPQLRYSFSEGSTSGSPGFHAQS